MRSALVLRGGPLFPVDWQTKGPEFGIQEWCFEARGTGGPLLTKDDIALLKQTVDGMRGAGYKVRIMVDPSWWPKAGMSFPDPGYFASVLDGYIRALGADSKQLSLMVDYEGKDPAWILATLRAIRAIRTGRSIVWTPEGQQSGWIGSASDLVSWINAEPLLAGAPATILAPQAYDSQMGPWSADEIRVDLWNAGIKRDRVEPFYSNKVILGSPKRWSGFLYDWTNFAAAHA